jgi:Periplasmic binding protein
VADKPLHDKGIDTDKATPQQLADLGKSLGMAYVLGGGAAEVPADEKGWAASIAHGGDDAVAARKEQARYAKARWFNLVAELIDTSTAEIVAQRRFQFSKYKTPPPNPLGIQGLYLPAPASDVTQIVPNLRFYDLKPVLFGSDLWELPELAPHLGDLEGASFSTGFWSDSTRPEVQHFTNAYKQAYAAKPGLLAAEAYDAARIMLDALAHGVSDRMALRTALSSADLDGVSGHTSFGGHQDAQKRLPIVEIKNGQLKEIESK